MKKKQTYDIERALIRDIETSIYDCADNLDEKPNIGIYVNDLAHEALLRDARTQVTRDARVGMFLGVPFVLCNQLDNFVIVDLAEEGDEIRRIMREGIANAINISPRLHREIVDPLPFDELPDEPHTHFYNVDMEGD